MYTYFFIIALWKVLGSFLLFNFLYSFFRCFFKIYFVFVLQDDEWDVRLMVLKSISFKLLNLGFCYLSVILVVSALHAGQLQFSQGSHRYLLIYSFHWPTDQILNLKQIKRLSYGKSLMRFGNSFSTNILKFCLVWYTIGVVSYIGNLNLNRVLDMVLLTVK